MAHELQRVLQYHQATKHQPGRFARGPRFLDWATQPDPFRRYAGAPIIALDRIPPGEDPPYEPSLVVGHVQPAPLSMCTVSRLFFDSMALSSWKRAGDETWALRVNPSSGNLHPTESYLICGPVAGLTEQPVVAHYAPREHVLEVRFRFPLATWQDLTSGLPDGALLLGLSSVHWREAWKYGERAFRYCQLDVGHAIGAISLAAAGLGWQVTLLDDLGTRQVSDLLGVSDPQGAEAEHPDCVLAVHPQGTSCASLTLPGSSLVAFARPAWQGRPNQLSPGHVDWPMIDEIAAATVKPPTKGVYSNMSHRRTNAYPGAVEKSEAGHLSLRKIIHQRRSAVAMDPHGTISRNAFYRILLKTQVAPGEFPFNALPWKPLVHLVLFVHRVHGLAPGLYLLVRDPEQRARLRSAMTVGFTWQQAPSCPADLGLYQLLPGDAQAIARQLSCDQDIAADGCFSLGMIADFEEPLQSLGPWFYRRLYWECGMIGQALYLEAEAIGGRGTGIGCFFDDAVHQLLGLETMRYQSLYHFTVGYAIQDTRLTTLPAYPSQ